MDSPERQGLQEDYTMKKFPSHVVGYSEAVVVSFEVKLPPYLAAVVAELHDLEESRIEQWIDCFRKMMQYHYEQQRRAMDKRLAEAPETDIPEDAEGVRAFQEARREIAARG